MPVYELPLSGVRRSPNEGQVQLAAFADYGWARSKGEFDLKLNFIYSAVAGVHRGLSEKIHTALYGGYPFHEVNIGDEGRLNPVVNRLV